MDLELTGKRALVTGGGRGMGKAIARQLALEGADVAIASRTSAQLEATANEIAKESGRKIHWSVVDTSDAAAISPMVADCAAALGGIDILVNAAALPGSSGSGPSSWDRVTEDELFYELRVKVLGYLLVAQAAVPHMIENKWGRVINISGVAARSAVNVVASVRNVAVVAMSKNLADELAQYGINVTTLHPGPTRTETTSPDRVAHNLIDRFVEVSEVANVVTFLASPKSVAITGDVIAAGGGVRGPIYY